ncbi:MAG: riboflavin synthase [Verrucomicrobiota bacterium]
MFTGIVEGTGAVELYEPREAAIRLRVAAGPLAEGVKPGDSVAVNGCCLTVVEVDGPRLSFDLLAETAQRTNIGTLEGKPPGSTVNLERSLTPESRLGGHFVTGHIDGTGEVRRFEPVGKDFELEVAGPPDTGRYLVPKGCIAVDGMSLTVVNVDGPVFSIWIIPHTREVTCLRERQPGDRVNLEFDLLAKYTEKLLSGKKPESLSQA